MLMKIIVVFNFLASCRSATDFCSAPLGMKRRIILNEQITESSYFRNLQDYKGFSARLDNNYAWCSFTGSTLDQQWVKVDLRYPMSIRGISIQGDPQYFPNYIKKFKLRYSVDGTAFLYKTDDGGAGAEEFTGANGQSQTIHRMFTTKPFAARYFEFRPTQFDGHDACIRFELYGCAYVCNQGLGIEHGNAFPTGFIMTSSSSQSGKGASSARLSDTSSSWCASSNDQSQYLQIDFGKVLTITGIAVQGNPSADSWVKDFYFDYGMELSSLVTYQEYGANKLFVGNEDRSTRVVNWFKVRLFARYIRIKPNSWNGNICMRCEIIGCHTEPVYELGVENRVLDNSRFSASGFTEWAPGRYRAHDGRLNNDRPWGISKPASPWFKVDLGRVMLVNGISVQGDGVYGPNYYPDYKIQYSFDASVAVGALVTIKDEITSSEKVFPGNTNNVGVKFNLLMNPISTRHVQFIKNTNSSNDYTLRVEIYGRPQACTKSFGMEAGSVSTYNPTVSVSTGSTPADKAKLNSLTAWCAGTNDVNQYFEYNFGGIRTISGFAIQGHPVDLKWVETFNVQYKQQQSQSYTTYEEGGSNKVFVGCKTRNLIVYHWFSSNLRMRYLRIKPLTWNTSICLRLNVYGCPSDDCFSEVGISSNAIADASISSSTHVSSKEGHKGRLNMESVWEACQFGSCSPKESNGNKPWIQVCLSSIQRVSSIIMQGPGNFDNIAKVTEFSLKFGTSSSGSFQSYSLGGNLKKFTVSAGRYTSSQIDLPFAIVSKCIKLEVESQSPMNQNAGLRWELLGCSLVPQVSSVTITPSSPSTAKNGVVTLRCTANALPGVEMTWKKGSTVLTTSGVYEVGTTTFSNDNINYKATTTLKITATTSYVASSFQNCIVTDSSLGLAECKQSYECSVLNGGLTSTTRSNTMEVTVTGFQAKPSKPSHISHSSLTNTSVSLTWSSGTPAEFPIKDYKAVVKKKIGSTVIVTISNLKTTSAAVSGLHSFTEYIIEISAQSSLGVFSDAAIYKVKTDEGVSTAPKNLSATSHTATSILVTWSHPNSFNGILHGYKIRYKPSSEVRYGNSAFEGKELNYTVNKLKPFTDYELQVQATTKGGLIFGIWSTIINCKTLEGAASAPTNVSAIAISATRIFLTWSEPASLNGILHDYKIRLKLASDVTYGSSISAGSQLLYTINGLRPFTVYDIQIQATTNGSSILGAWSSVVTVSTKIYVIPKPKLRNVSSLEDVNIKVTLEKVSSNISWYRLFFIKDNASRCSQALQNTFNENINPSRLPMTLEFKPGIKAVQGTALEMGTLGNYSLCYQAIIQDKLQTHSSDFATFSIERKSLEKMDQLIDHSEISLNSFIVPLAKGPANTISYHVIVMEGSRSSKPSTKWTPIELGPYDASTYKAGKPYITAVLSSYAPNISIGDGKVYSSSKRKRRSIGNIICKNVALKANTEYLIFQRAYVSKDVYYSSPWLGPVKTRAEQSGAEQSNTKETKRNLDTVTISSFASVAFVLILIIFVLAITMIRKRPSKSANSRPRNDGIPMGKFKDNRTFEADQEYNYADETVASVAGNLSHLKRDSLYEQIDNGSNTYEALGRRDGETSYEEVQMTSDNSKSYRKAMPAAQDRNNRETSSGLIGIKEHMKRRHSLTADDANRVNLQQSVYDNISNSDYINAIFVEGHNNKHEYIATQHPLQDTMGSFWKMIHQEKVKAVVMLNKLKEGGVALPLFWPAVRKRACYEEMIVSTEYEAKSEGSIDRKFTITHGRDVHEVKMFHFEEWPENGVPKDNKKLLKLISTVQDCKQRENNQQPIVVMCRDGGNCTGAFLAISITLDRFNATQSIDVFGVAQKLRSIRPQFMENMDTFEFCCNICRSFVDVSYDKL